MPSRKWCGSRRHEPCASNTGSTPCRCACDRFSAAAGGAGSGRRAAVSPGAKDRGIHRAGPDTRASAPGRACARWTASRNAKRNAATCGSVNLHRGHGSGHPLRPARACEVARVYGGRGADAGAGDRRKLGGLRRFERADPAPAGCAAGGEPLRHPAQGPTTTAPNRIPTISTCATATAASTVWRRIPSISAGLDTGDNPSRAWVELVSGNYFDVLRHSAVSGPFLPRFRRARPQQRAVHRALLRRIGTRHFQDDRGVVGRVVRVNKHPVYHPRRGAAGVPRDAAVFLSRFLRADGEPGAGGRDELPRTRAATVAVFMVMGHLKAGVTPEQAAADLNSIGSYLEKTYPKGRRPHRLSPWRVPAFMATFWAVRCGHSWRD